MSTMAKNFTSRIIDSLCDEWEGQTLDVDVFDTRTVTQPRFPSRWGGWPARMLRVWEGRNHEVRKVFGGWTGLWNPVDTVTREVLVAHSTAVAVRSGDHLDLRIEPIAGPLTLKDAFVRVYDRHGLVGQTSLELPAGVIDDGVPHGATMVIDAKLTVG